MDNPPVFSPGRGLVNRVLGGRYELVETVGEGTLLTCFRAQDRALNRIVAVKILQEDIAALAGVREAFFDGLRQVIALNHAHVIRLFDVGEEDGLLYFVEEYVRGMDLKERIRRIAPYSVNAATESALALAESLKFIHSRGIAHGFLTPQGILVAGDGQVKVAGCGLGRVRQIVQAKMPTRFTDKEAYGLSGATGASADGDIFALGIILFEMLTGELPRPGAPVSPRAVNAGVPSALEGIVGKAVGSSEQRYKTASQMLEDLKSVQDALRFGKSLAWSPLESAPLAVPSGTDSELLTLPAPLRKSHIGAPPPVRAMPSAPVAPPITQSAPIPREETRRTVQYTANRWLTFVNLLLGLILLGGLGYLGWMAVNFTKPPIEVVVPNLVGKSVTESEQLAKQLGFTLAKVEETYRDKEPSTIIYQMKPEPGRKIREGKPVSVWVSKGPRLVEVPDVRDVSFDKARKSIEKVGLMIGAYTKEFDFLVAKGNIIRQTPQAGELRRRGEKIDLVLSKGEEPTAPPVEDTPVPGEVVEPSPDDVAPLPDTQNDPKPTDESDRTRVFEAKYDIPDDGVPHMIRIDIEDKNGKRTVYSKERRAGETVQEDVEGMGAKIKILLLDNDIVVKTTYSKSGGK